MNKRLEPYYNVDVEGDFRNWNMSGFIGGGEGKSKIDVHHITKNSGKVCIGQTVVKNISDTDIVLNHVSSVLYRGVGRFENNRYTVFICKCGWQGEMQWIEQDLASLGVYKASNHADTSVFEISCSGSQTTSEYYPLIMIEDTKLGITYYFETEPLSGWYIEIGIMGDDVYVETNSAFMGNDGWMKKLAPDEEYVSGRTFYGCAKGGFPDAVNELNSFKRTQWQTGDLKVVFNDYMNCLWAKPTLGKLKPLIDTAKEAGCEVFCVDAGWYGKDTSDNHLGDWFLESPDLGENGLSGIFDYIKSKDMLPGIWLEMECCASTSNVYKELNDCLLKRNGIIIGGSRAYLDFRTEKVRDYTLRAVDRLYKKGVRYIKNDYNHNLVFGCDGAESLSVGYAEHRKAFLDFICELKEKYTDLTIENCSSGAMRSDFCLLRNFDIQNLSDQEYYYNIPPILAGTMAAIPPERCGALSYPYPLLYENQPEKKDYGRLSIESDKEETVFNMVNSMLGAMCLSGHIDCADKENLELIKNGIEIYKTYRHLIPKSEILYLTPKLRIGEKGVMAVGLKFDNQIILAVWKIGTDDKTVKIPVSGYAGKNIEIAYPNSIKTEYYIDSQNLIIEMPATNTARLFRIY